MSEKQSRPSVRFCPGCGEPAAAGANFCTSCGHALRPEAPVRAGASSGHGMGLPSRTPGLAVMGAFLAIGLALWVGILKPGSEPARMPLAQKPPSAPAPPAAGGTTSGSLPPSHPPLEVPAEVRTFLADLERKAADSPGDLETWRNLAQVQYRAGQIDRSFLAKAEASYRKVLEIAPKDLDALRGLGNVHFDREEYPKAIEWYSAYLELDPDDPNVRTDLGTMYLYGGQETEAIREYEKVVANDPKFYQAHFNLGIAEMRRGRSDAALAALETAKSVAPDEETRGQIQAMIDRSGSSGPVDGSPGGFQQKIERELREHPIAGPKVVRLEWPGASEGRVVFDNFPMEQMPEGIRARFLDRLKTQLADAKRDTSTNGPAKLDLVDQASGKVMATVAID